ncbi:MAG: sulfatase-like hydrolase/transferase [Verrucomicrobiales bacterium]|nr:sulfatase-like hydrolase/transferase [Verrucomicrobiales bacterium]
MRSHSLLILLCLVVPATVFFSDAVFSKAEYRQAASDTRVIFISVDGLRPDAITTHGPEDVPNFYRLRNEGAFTDNARSAVNYTITLPNHTGMVTSRLVAGENGHGWTINHDPPIGMTLHKNKGGYIPSMFSVAHDHGLRTGMFVSKTKFSLFENSWGEKHGAPDLVGPDNGRNKIDRYEMKRTSELVIDKLERVMKKETFDLLMVHIRNPDTAGHVQGWRTTKPSLYMNSVKKADELLGDIFEKIDKSPDWSGKTYIVLTADHGGLTGAKQHNLNEQRENYTIPFYVWGPGVSPGSDLYALNPGSRQNPGELNPVLTNDGTQPIRNADAGNLCLDLLGLPAIPGSTVNSNLDLKVGR